MRQKTKTIDQVKVSVYLPVDLAARFDMYLLDPLTGRTKYGERSRVVELLVRRYIADLENGGRPV